LKLSSSHFGRGVASPHIIRFQSGFVSEPVKFFFIRHLRKYLNEDIVKELVGDAHAVAELEKEWEQLQEDRIALRQIFPTGENKVKTSRFISQ
jgi:hypothetical protein